MQRTHSMIALALTGVMGLSILAPTAASASEQGKRNTAIGLGALAAGLLLTQKNKLPGILAAGGAAYAYSQYDKDVRARHQREQYGYYDNYGYRQNNGYRSHENGANSGYYQDRYDWNQGSRTHEDSNHNYRENYRNNRWSNQSSGYHSHRR